MDIMPIAESWKLKEIVELIIWSMAVVNAFELNPGDGSIQFKPGFREGNSIIPPCDLLPSITKGKSYYRRYTPWGKWLDMPCPPGTVFIERWCRCDYPEMKDLLSGKVATKGLETTQKVKHKTTSLPTKKSTTLPKRLTSNIAKVTSKTKTTETEVKSTSLSSVKQPTTTVKLSTSEAKTTVKILTTEPTRTVKISTTEPTRAAKISSTSKQTQSTTTQANLTTTKDKQYLTTTSSINNMTNSTSSETKAALLTTKRGTISKLLTFTTPSKMPDTPRTKNESTITTNNVFTSNITQTTTSSEHPTTTMSTSSKVQNKTEYEVFSTTKTPKNVNQNVTSANTLKKFTQSFSLQSTNLTQFSSSQSNSKTMSTGSDKTVNSVSKVSNTITKSTVLTTKPSPKELETTLMWTKSTRSQLRTTTKAPIRCEFLEIVDDKSSYLGYINTDIGWIRFQCPHHHEFSLRQCGCINPADEVKDNIKPTTVGIPKGCPYVKEGKKSFREYIDILKSWVYSECSEGYIFSQSKCGCLLKEDAPEEETFQSTTPLITTTLKKISKTPEKVPEGCPYIAAGKATFKEYVKDIQSWVFSDCSPGHVFRQSECRCEAAGSPSGCPFIAVGKSSFKEYIDVLGDWVVSDCPNNHVYSEKKCQCILYVDCKHEAVDRTSFKTFVKEVQNWVYSDCPENHFYSAAVCKCVSEGGENTAEKINGVDTKLSTQSPSTVQPQLVTTADCKAVGIAGGYKKYLPEIGGWVNYDCPIHTEFNQRLCSCQRSGCKYITDGTGYKEFVDILGTWIFYDCPIGTTFQTEFCQCKPGEVNVPNMPTTTNFDNVGNFDKVTERNGKNPDCSKITKGNGYMEFVASLQDWVYYDCPLEESFNEAHCTCLHDRSHPGSHDHTIGCEFTSSGDGTYRKYVDEIHNWVSYDCPVGEIFDTTVCKCVSKAGNTKGTTKRPLVATTSPECDMKPSDMGPDFFMAVVPGHGDILYQCDFGYVYKQSECGCVEEVKPTTAITTTTNPGCPLLPSPLGERYFRMQAGIIGLIDFACPTGQTFKYRKCVCVS